MRSISYYELDEGKFFVAVHKDSIITRTIKGLEKPTTGHTNRDTIIVHYEELRKKRGAPTFPTPRQLKCTAASFTRWVRDNIGE
jgi:hypothetical protein